MADKQLKLLLVGDSSSWDKTLSQAQKDLIKFSDKVKNIGQSLSIGLTAPIVAAGAASFKMASDFNESLNKVNVAFKNSAGIVKDFAKTSLTSFGIAESSALDMAALFGDMATSMGISRKESAKLSTSLVGLAGDLASFKNMNIGEVTTALNGIFTGETESLKRLGVVMTEANLQTYALSKGIREQYSDMTQAEKVMLRYQYVTAMTANAQGDFARTGGGAANQMRIFSESMKELGQSFGEIILPSITQVIKSANSLVQSFRGLDEGTKKVVIAIAGIAALSGPLLYIAGSVIPKVIAGFNLLTAAIGSTNAAIAGKAGLIGLLALAGYQLYMFSRETDNYNRKGGISSTVSQDKNEVAKKIVALKQLIQTTKEQQKQETEQQKSLSDAKIFTYTTQLNNLRSAYKNLTQDLSDNSDSQNKGNILTDEQIKKNQEAQSSWINLKNKITDFKYEFDSLTKDLIDFKNQNITYAPSIGNPKELDKFQKANLDILKSQAAQQGGGNITIKSPMEVMAENIKPALDTINQATQQGLAYIDGWNNKMAEMQQATQTAFESIGMSIVNSLGLGNNAIGQFIGSIAQLLVKMAAASVAENIFAKQKIATEQAKATATAVNIGAQSAQATGPGALFTLAPFIALAVGAIGAAFSGIPKFAAGGIVSGPTMGLMGEYPGAKSNPEVIAPLNKLQGMLGNSGSDVNVTGEFVVRGQDLVLALNRAEKNYNKLT